MDSNGFWQIIRESRAHFDPALKNGNKDRQIEELKKLLVQLSADEIVAFDHHFTARFHESYQWELWAAAYIIGGGCSDDWFDYFRFWLISMGKEVYEAALSDPESLVDVASDDGVESIFFERFSYVAIDIYEMKTGQAMPAGNIKYPDKPTGKDWQEDELPNLLPKLWAKYGEDDD